MLTALDCRHSLAYRQNFHRVQPRRNRTNFPATGRYRTQRAPHQTTARDRVAHTDGIVTQGAATRRAADCRPPVLEPGHPLRKPHRRYSHPTAMSSSGVRNGALVQVAGAPQTRPRVWGRPRPPATPARRHATALGPSARPRIRQSRPATHTTPARQLARTRPRATQRAPARPAATLTEHAKAATTPLAEPAPGAITPNLVGRSRMI